MGCVYHRLTFTRGIALESQLEADHGFEVAFAGRSNVGKSSALNTVANHRGLARTSKTPGRTQQINLFEIDSDRRIADLPGYGYAAVAHETQRAWETLLQTYIESRQCLRGIVVFMDSRRPFTEIDQQMLSWCARCNHAIHVVLTKSDKLGSNETRRLREHLQKLQQDFPSVSSIQLFSSHTRDGLTELYATLDRWFEQESSCG